MKNFTFCNLRFVQFAKNMFDVKGADAGIKALKN